MILYTKLETYDLLQNLCKRKIYM